MTDTLEDYTLAARRIMRGGSLGAAGLAEFVFEKFGHGRSPTPGKRFFDAFASRFGREDFVWPMLDQALAVYRDQKPGNWPFCLIDFLDDGDDQDEGVGSIAWYLSGLKKEELSILAARVGVDKAKSMTKEQLLAVLAQRVDAQAIQADIDAAMSRHKATRNMRLVAEKAFLLCRTCLAAAYGIHRERQIRDGGYPLLVYRSHSCDYSDHAELDGLIVDVGSAFATQMTPPSRPGCSCGFLGARSIEGAVRLGGNPRKRPTFAS